MKCSKCGFDNADDALFCEKCDWKLSETYIPEMKVNRAIFSYIALIVGIIAVIPIIIGDMLIISLILGAIGLVLGGYSFNASRLMNLPNKNLLLALGGIGLLLSVIAFMYGLTILV